MAGASSDLRRDHETGEIDDDGIAPGLNAHHAAGVGDHAEAREQRLAVRSVGGFEIQGAGEGQRRGFSLGGQRDRVSLHWSSVSSVTWAGSAAGVGGATAGWRPSWFISAVSFAR